MNFNPKAANQDVQIPTDLLQLLEQLAEKTHEAWIRQRVAEGWRYGPQRDDVKKEHPNLVPYKDLQESEKEYDRQISLGTIKSILSWGYRIQSPPIAFTAPIDLTEPVPVEVAAIQDALIHLSSFDLQKTLALWQRFKSLNRVGLEKIYQDLGQHLLRLGEPLLAYDIVAEGLQAWPQDLRLRQLMALALLRSGAALQSLQILQRLNEEGHRDEETLGLMARAYKDLALQATNPGEKNQLWQKAYDLYVSTYELTGGYWTGINAATLARCLRNREQAMAIAEKVADQCFQKLSSTKVEEGENFWLKATLGEAALIREQWEEAIQWYMAASRIATDRLGDLASTRRNARILCDVMEVDRVLRQRIESCFPIPAVVVFPGQSEPSGSPCPTFPDHLEYEVAEKIAAALNRLDARIGFSSAASQADILFLEALLARNGEANVILPFLPEAFKETTSACLPGEHWRQRLNRVLSQATNIIIANDHSISATAVTSGYASLLQEGLAILRARILDAIVIPLLMRNSVKWKENEVDAASEQLWRAKGMDPVIIDFDYMEAGNPSLDAVGVAMEPVGSPPGSISWETAGYTQKLMAILFADVVGSSRVTEEQVPAFIEYFMRPMYDLICISAHKPVLTNTWGDALYGVFDSVVDAGKFALELRDRIGGTDWQAKGLPKDINLRISLHAGPVYCAQQPFFKELRYSGSHVIRAARIEPITPPGQVYASQQFAALSASQQVYDFTCEYVGQVPLPKSSVVVPLFLVRQN